MELPVKIHKYIVLIIAEVCASSFLLYFGCLSSLGESSLTRTALSWGSLIAAIVTIYGPISNAHVNPCVTLCTYLLGKVNLVTALIYTASDTIGSILGFLLMKATVPLSHMANKTANTFCTTRFKPNVSVGSGMFVEFMGTAFLILAVCSALDPRNTYRGDSAAIKIGCVVIIVVYVLEPLTGASINPARSFAPALVNGVWDYYWAYLVAQICATLFSALFYKYVYLQEVIHEFKCDSFANGTIRDVAPADDVQNKR